MTEPGENLPALPSLSRYDGPDPFPDPNAFSGVLWRRVLAYLIDATLLFVLIFLCLPLLITMGLVAFGPFFFFGLSPLAFCIALLYHGLQLSSRFGATLGMRAMGIGVRSVIDGGVPSKGQAFAHAALFFLTVPTTGFLVLALVFFTDKSRTLHEILSGTVTIRAHAPLPSSV